MRRSHRYLFITVFILAFLTLTWSDLKHGIVKSSSSSRKNFTILAVGDVMLGRSVNANIQMRQDPVWPFANVADQLNSADLTIGNLENPLINNCPIKRDGMIFCGSKTNAEGLVRAGFDYLSLANNHTLNYGQAGLNETKNILEEYGLGYYGDGQSAITEVNGIKLSLLGFDDIAHRLNINSLTLQIVEASSSSDLVIVHFHWGQEYVGQSNARQQELARAAIDAGADLVFGAHPHVVQDSEYYHGKPIYYSFGNFIFDQEWSRETKRGLAVRFTYIGDTLQSVEELPVSLKNYGQAFWE